MGPRVCLDPKVTRIPKLCCVPDSAVHLLRLGTLGVALPFPCPEVGEALSEGGSQNTHSSTQHRRTGLVHQVARTPAWYQAQCGMRQQVESEDHTENEYPEIQAFEMAFEGAWHLRAMCLVVRVKYSWLQDI